MGSDVSTLISMSISTTASVTATSIALRPEQRLIPYRERIPVARQETALEFWISGCICLVFAALAEYAFILFKMVRIKRRRRRNRERLAGYNVEQQREEDELPTVLFN